MYQAEVHDPGYRARPIDPSPLPGEHHNRTQTLSPTGQRYLKAKPIALAALDIRAADRDRFIATACRGDNDLLKEVLWMLAAAQDDTSAMPWPLQAGLPSETLLQTTCGSRYRIIRQIGRGGMGVVYLAERQIHDQGELLVSQVVALKLLRKHARSHQLMRRFFEERRILAKLNHPNIAHLVDCGTTSDGRAFLAMEYVEGERIDRWCERAELSLHERLELFLKICSAVHYAHQQCVIHRDIKPINILVNEFGDPKLLDFGIARLIDPVAGIADVQTQTVHRALTLAYASPEQIRGLPLSTATEVWSLGVLLYQLTCGICPFSFDEHGQRVPKENDAPPLPSSFYDSLPANRGTVDIDLIITKALRHDPADRHTDVAQLAHELRSALEQRLIHDPLPCESAPKASRRHPSRPTALRLLAAPLLVRLNDFSHALRKPLRHVMAMKYPSIARGYALATIANVRGVIHQTPCALGIPRPFDRADDSGLRGEKYRHSLSLAPEVEPTTITLFRTKNADPERRLAEARPQPKTSQHHRDTKLGSMTEQESS